MSLTDPLESERRKTTDYRGSSRTLAVALIWGFVGLLAAAVIGFGVGGSVDQMRVMSINSVFGNWEAGVPVMLRSFALPVGIIGCIVCFSQYGKWNHRYTGRATYYAVVGPLTLILFGLALGVWIATTMWAAPDAVGTAADPVFHEDEPWGAGAWIMYAAQWWLPGLFAVLAVASLIAGLASRRYRSRNAELVAELLRSGTLVDAEVVKSPPHSSESARVTANLTLKFQDASGRDRWVRCLALLPPSEVPFLGERRPLVFDPRDPGNTKRIFVSPSGRGEAGDFVGVKGA